MSVQQLLLGASGASGYNIDRSLRFRASASAYLNRTPAGAGNRQIYTWNGWVKRGTLGSAQRLFVASDNNFIDDSLNFLAGDTLTFYLYNSSYQAQLVTTQVFRDPSAWYMITVAVDTTQATAANRVKIYVNGSQVTAFSTATYPTQNLNAAGFNTTNPHNIGRYVSGTNYFDGYLADVNFIDGQALTPASFGETNVLTGVWQPKAYTGTYGTNGFYLDFEDTSSVAALGTDDSGNGNTWTVNNISLTAGVTYDSMTDVPTLTSATAANYAVLNPISGAFTSTTFSAGNLDMLVSGGVFNKGVAGTIAISKSGKWYFELNLNSGAGTPGGVAVGFGAVSGKLYGDSADLTSLAWATDSAGNIYANSSSIATATNWNTNGKICACTIDYVNNEIKFYVDNVLSYTLSGANFPIVDVMPLVHNSARGISINFGQRPFAYTPPTGFVALNTFNLPTSTIVKGNTVMDATLYTGTGASLAVTNAGGFRPDLVWVKSRSNATSNLLTDSVRGVTQALVSNVSSAEATDTQGLTAFNSNGYTLGTDANYNGSARTFVGWQWQAGQGSSSSNTAGTITSTVSVNATAGFSIATYTGTGANATVGHGLGVAPKMIIVKNRNSTFTWRVYHAFLANTQVLYLSATDAATTETTAWNSTTPTSTVFSVGTGSGTNGSTNTYVAYCWSEIAGFSKFGGYTGNGSTDGAFIYTGFRPRFVMVKQTNNVGNWLIWDTARSTYNQMQDYLVPNSSTQELNNVLVSIDALSNGFKCRTSDNDINGNGDTYIYAAFAENPLKNSLAR